MDDGHDSYIARNPSVWISRSNRTRGKWASREASKIKTWAGSALFEMTATRSKRRLCLPSCTDITVQGIKGVDKMTQGLFKRLALTAPLVLCLPLCTIAADGSASSDDEMPKIFEEFSLTSASTEAPTAAPSALPSAAACVTSPACA